jgi:hypothetical protein
MLRLESWIRPAGVSPVPVGAGAPGSRPQSRGEIPAAERGVESLFGGSKRAGWDCSLVKVTTGEPSRSCHGEGHVRQSLIRIGHGGSLRGTETCTRARSDHGTRETRLCSLVSKDHSYKSMAKSSGGQRESVGVVVVRIGVQKNAPGAKDPRFDRACVGRERQDMAAHQMRSKHPGGRRPAEPPASVMAVMATCRSVARARPRCRLWVAAKRPGASQQRAKRSRWGDSLRTACCCRVFAGRVAAPGRSSVSRVRENRTHGLKGESGNGLA